MKVQVTVEKSSNLLPAVAVLIIGAIIGAAGYYLLVKKKKS
jgi:uncharacterized membrane-anchored protein